MATSDRHLDVPRWFMRVFVCHTLKARDLHGICSSFSIINSDKQNNWQAAKNTKHLEYISVYEENIELTWKKKKNYWKAAHMLQTTKNKQIKNLKKKKKRKRNQNKLKQQQAYKCI